jgi:hypothetical protein
VAVTTAAAPVVRMGHTAVWTGSEMIIWGGTNWNSSTGTQYFNDTWSYTPGKMMILYQKP